MIPNLLKKIFGSRNERLLKQYRAVVAKINALEPEFERLSDSELAAKTEEYKRRYQDGVSLDHLLPEAFATVREAAKRVHGMRHYDVQLIGGMALHNGKIAEMRTGEGKTLMATLPAYLNALTGEGVHIVTVNDYLASRDADWMGRIYRFLGLTVGVNLPQMPHEQKQAAYAADITYGTNNEFGFDYLRDNMVYHPSQRVQRKLAYAIVDEVDSILIDEARTPLIISGQADDNVALYQQCNQIPARLTRQEKEYKEGETGPLGDYIVDEKAHTVLLTEQGHEKVEQILTEIGLLPPGGSLYDAANITLMHHVYAALRAHVLYHKDQHYVVQNGEVVIVDEFTGRLMTGRRWSDGLHQAVEAKEGVPIQRENQTLASITFQNYFRMYAKLSGMTGTADTEAYEFQQIYGLETVVIPTNKPMIRLDHADRVYRTAAEKWQAVIHDLRDCHARGQPVLVGTTSIEVNEFLSDLLKKEGLPHQVLNAKQHASEAQVIAQAGLPGAITIATNMAGRGTDIVLGGNIAQQVEAIRNDPNLSEDDKHAQIALLKADWQKLHDQVIAAGGLYIVGTERHESRRVDNQLRGRSGRQGDPGASRFYLSLDDPLLRIFGGERLSAIMARLKMPEGEAIEHPMVNRSLESAQRKVEQRNFDIRKQLLEYDDVANDQRRVIYQQRNEILETDDVSAGIRGMRADVLNNVISEFIPPGSIAEQWDVDGLTQVLAAEFQLHLPLAQWLAEDEKLAEEGLREKILAAADAAYAEKEALAGAENLRHFERAILLQTLDNHWREHLAAMDHLRQGIHLRGYAQKNPKQEYKREAFQLFSAMLDTIAREVTQITLTVQIKGAEDVEAVAAQAPELDNVQYHHADYDEALAAAEEQAPAAQGQQPVQRQFPKVGRNDPCPCGSGKKYKHCHGKLA
ncbi:protein translocase subunit secA [Sulfuritortus calidifontis]|uniref:Protein translocase subunit SecA n=1 Tax=Sulfuritortus calidifontis TaxID=1914471 RepID=A0A4R3JW77_9PROT|nr:preprotein translocase subunit SecA [Sulfuritortus calidifontis]TCS72464.1 protein translocase subunit secA [Sulfuritortus calidifontis]